MTFQPKSSVNQTYHLGSRKVTAMGWSLVIEMVIAMGRRLALMLLVLKSVIGLVLQLAMGLEFELALRWVLLKDWMLLAHTHGLVCHNWVHSGAWVRNCIESQHRYQSARRCHTQFDHSHDYYRCKRVSWVLKLGQELELELEQELELELGQTLRARSW